MAKVTKDHADWPVDYFRSKYRTDSYESRYALSRMSVFTDGITWKKLLLVHGMDADVLVQQINDFLGE